MKNTLIIISGVLLSTVLSCNESKINLPFIQSIQELPSPAAKGSGEPNLYVAGDGRVFLSWIEPGAQQNHSLRFSIWEEEQWLKPHTIAEGDNWFVNWADFPSLLAMKDDRLAAHWLVKSGENTFAYNVNISQSTDGGVQWNQPVVPHRDSTTTEHGFVSMLPWDKSRFLAVWLDGRQYARKGKPDGGDNNRKPGMSLRAALIDRAGSLSDEMLLDERTCDCCQTSAARTASGAIVAYRDRSEDEIRDISIVRFTNGEWSEPQTLYNDDWEINGCPVNGPSVASIGDQVAIAWFTEAKQKRHIKVIFSSDGGTTFGQPVLVDDGHPIGRVDIILLQDGSAVVSWIEATRDGEEIRIRRVQPDGTKNSSIFIAKTSVVRASGFPQMVRSGGTLFLTWTKVASPTQIAVIMAKLNLPTTHPE